MPTVALADLEAGAVLSQAVYSPRGILLAPPGTVLTATHLAIFSSWGVAEAVIEGAEAVATDEQPTARALSEAEILEVQRLVEDRFSLVVPLYPFMREVRRVTEMMLIRRLERGELEE